MFLRGAAHLIALTLLVPWSCGGESGSGSDAASAFDGGSTAALGSFTVTMVPAMSGGGGTQASPAYTSVLGKVHDGPVPAAVVWTVVEEANGCRLSTPRVPFCSVPCGGAAVCVEGGTCVPQPKAQDLGRVHVTGLGTGAFDMEPIAGSYQPSAGVMLPYPPFPEGGVVRMAAPGGALGAFSLESRGIAPLVFDQNPALVSGQPLRLTWATPGQPDLSRIEVKLDISHHGADSGTIECDVPDTGTLEIPASQVSKLLGLGVAGFPTIVVTRAATGTAAVRAGVITLRVLSIVERAVEIEGLRSCTGDGECPAGKKCRSDLTCG
jgi:hypothetical protein